MTAVGIVLNAMAALFAMATGSLLAKHEGSAATVGIFLAITCGIASLVVLHSAWATP